MSIDHVSGGSLDVTVGSLKEAYRAEGRLGANEPLHTVLAFDLWQAEDCVGYYDPLGRLGIARPYDLRHGFASLLLAEQRNLAEIASQLGHSLQMLLSTYAPSSRSCERSSGSIRKLRSAPHARKPSRFMLPRCCLV